MVSFTDHDCAVDKLREKGRQFAIELLLICAAVRQLSDHITIKTIKLSCQLIWS